MNDVLPLAEDSEFGKAVGPATALWRCYSGRPRAMAKHEMMTTQNCDAVEEGTMIYAYSVSSWKNRRKSSSKNRHMAKVRRLNRS
jgi:hypothetical protein